MPENALEFAKNLARQAGAIMSQNFTIGMKKEWKNDDTPLTETDVKINQLVLDAIQEEYPAHSVLSEEGSRLTESEYTWVCDPVDGTVPFSHGYPTFAFSLALTKNGKSILGVIYDPILDRLLHAVAGKGAFLNGEKISVSSVKELSKTSLVECNAEERMLPFRKALTEIGCYIPSVYSCVYAGLLVAVGELAGSVYPYDKAWDGAAVKIIVEEAGGKVTDLQGNEQDYNKTINGFVAGNPSIHATLIKFLNLPA